MAQPTPNPHPILPDNPDLLPIHTRNYEVRAIKAATTAELQEDTGVGSALAAAIHAHLNDDEKGQRDDT